MLVLAVDVGTKSARCALVDEQGRIRARAVEKIHTLTYQYTFFREHGSESKSYRQQHFCQSTDNIWNAICSSCHKVLSNAGVTGDMVNGIAFDATCSLAVVDNYGQPLSVCPEKGCTNMALCDSHVTYGDPDMSAWNVILWMDHRAEQEAEVINKTGHFVLDHVGGSISPEMQLPKVLWLKHHLYSSCYQDVGHFFDLPDYLTYRATGSSDRSLCSLVCKWTYVHEPDSTREGFQGDLLKEIDLFDELQKDGGSTIAGPPADFHVSKLSGNSAAPVQRTAASRLGTTALRPGCRVGSLSTEAARSLGLVAGIPVAAGSIDAHAGVLGVIGDTSHSTHPVTQRLVSVLGTSSCHMTVAKHPVQMRGIWGPYYEVVLPECWLNEGGQSSSGALLDLICESHVRYTEAVNAATAIGITLVEWLNRQAYHLAEDRCLPTPWHICQDMHILPFFHGNRSPLCDSSLRGIVAGLTMSSNTLDGLVELYISTVIALSLEARHVITSMEDSGFIFKSIHVCGGLCHNSLYLQAYADATQLPVHYPEEDAVLIGTAVLAATASGHFATLEDAMVKEFLDRKFSVYTELYSDFRKYRSIMED